MNSDPDDRSEDSRARRRAALILGAIVLVAVVVAGIMIHLARGSNGDRPTADPTVLTSAVAVTPSVPVTTARPTPTVKPPPKSTTTCATPPCALIGDPGNVLAAVNAYRAGQALPAVTGSATAAAGVCALNSGNAPFCPGSYYWMPVPHLLGTEVVTQIAGFGGGRTWLLNPRMTTIAIGWAEASPDQFQCAVIDASAAR